ncbi:DUF6039 family protein [Saccharothrix coeruleofusca]|uniref:Uncharacterized protein n=1 Tax=Saccharothrix coeruleofusca TaxID=33919 RepID=A0A918ASU3_9PSEU|nr:DUF6039 family protein [Saccharothrix coeruleofusca]MBP2336647.1 hypothetical protein [Saccharothrix coeruleofusca]GGP78982.1 hypothetical protein GCM10010185_61100 [Saccharothrix coeruleofusca]
MSAGPSTAFTIPVAQDQTSLSPDEVLHSGNAGVIVERVGQLRSEFRSEGRQFGRELAEYLNTAYRDVVTVFVYEETFGTKDRLHFLMHLKSLEAYETLVGMGTRDEGWREIMMRQRIPAERGGGTWDRVFLDGTLRETVLLPSTFGMYGTADKRLETVVADGDGAPRFQVPVAQQQTTLPPDRILHSANCGILMHRVGQLKYEFRVEGRQFARALCDAWNESLAGHATIFLYEEAFGVSDRIHHFIHLKSLSSYYTLMGLRAVSDAASREVFTRQWIPEEKGGGSWERMFEGASLQDMALTPQHWGMYATRAGGER